LAIKDQDPG